MRLKFLFFSTLISTPIAAASAQTAVPVAARVETTLETRQDHIRQLAFDGDPASFFASTGDAGPSDQFTLLFEEPVSVTSLSAATGNPEGGESLENGVLEVSADGAAFEELAKFADGKVEADPKGRKIKAIRLKPTSELKHPLVIREIKVQSDPPVAPFAYPVEYTVDVKDAPELKEWAEKVARLCESWYPKISETLKSDGYTPPRQVNLRLTTSYNGVAMAGGNRITGSVKFFKAHPEDLGAMIHETVHIIQHYRGRGNPGWLVEGVADHVRFFQYEPGKIGPINAERAHYNGSYRITARFLAYLTEKYDPKIVPKLNTLMREGKYKEETFKELTGKDLKELDEEWRATLTKR